MVDHDVFRRHVDPRFRTAVTAVFDRTDPSAGLGNVLHAASNFLKDGGCPGLSEIAALIVGYARQPNSDVELSRVLFSLDDVQRGYANERTARAIRVAKKFVRTLAQQGVRQLDNAAHEADRAEQFTSQVILTFVELELFPGRLIQELVESGRETWDSFRERKTEVLMDLERSDGVSMLAKELLANSDGSQVKRQIVRRVKVDQRELAISEALT